MNFIMFTLLPHSRRYDLRVHYLFIILRVSSEKSAWVTTGRTTVTLMYLLQFHAVQPVIEETLQILNHRYNALQICGYVVKCSAVLVANLSTCQGVEDQVLRL